MEAGKPSFMLDLDDDKNFKPLPSATRKSRGYKPDRVFVPDTYPVFDEEFFDLVKSCASYIESLKCKTTKKKLHKELSKIFVIRHKGSALRLFRELVNLKTLEGENHACIN